MKAVNEKKAIKFDFKNLTQKQIFFYISVLALTFCCVPLFVIAHFNHMSVDDYAFSNYAIDNWRQYHSVFRLLKTQFEFAHGFYYSWQGTISMTWLGGAITVMICENAYFLSTYITLGGFVASELFLFNLIGTKALGADKYDSGIVSCWILILQILMVPYPVEAFFWANSGIMYIGAYSLTVLLYAFMMVYLMRSEKRTGISIAIVILSVLIAFGSYLSALFVLSSYLLLLFSLFVKKLRGRLFFSVNFIIYLASFMINAMAPGNQVRQAVVGPPECGPVKAVIKSLFAAAEYIVCNLYPTVLIILVMMVPFIIGIVSRKAFGDKKVFRCPLIFTVLSFGLYASLFVPTTYSLGDLVSGRVVNIYRLSMYVWLFANLIYWTGWLLSGLHQAHPEITEESLHFKKNYLLLSMAAGVILFCFSAYFYGGKTLTTVSAIESLSSGQASLYRAEHEERLSILKDESVKDAVLDEYTDPPYLLYVGDIQADSGNGSVAKFYGKDSVTLRLWK